MAEKRPVTSPLKERLARWLPVAAVACGLLALSQALWLWQSWPVRELLQASQPLPPAGPRP